MRLFGLIGYPLTHSFSKKYFTDKFKTEGLEDCSFRNFELPSIDKFPSFIKENPDLRGLSVTIPYKEDIIPYLTWENGIVKETGACNCIKIRDGNLYGYNTDVAGFEESLIKKLKPEQHTKALILGRGGAAKAVAYVLRKLNIQYKFAERDPDTNDKRSVSYNKLTERLIIEHLLIINCTPLGMFPNDDTYPPLVYNAITPSHYLFDLTYNPQKSLFLQQGEERGATIQNGYDMLIAQAEESWKIWNG
jgi:shikimate dehydrogenase